MENRGGDVTESRKTGKQMNAHQANVDRYRERNAVASQFHVSPTNQNNSRNSADRNLRAEKCEIATFEETCHQLIAFRRHAAAYPNDREDRIEEVKAK